MKLSTKARYGLRAVVEIAKTYGATAPSKRKDIAASQNISDSYLENILIVLKNNRIVETTRGANGGYVLCREPSKINVYEVVTALEGPMDLVDCVGNTASCGKTSQCAAHSVWKEIADQWRIALEKISLKDMLDREKALGSQNYSI
jgi:Rrf2 family transcriptional regulator, cysteine metabolism repressor